MTARPSPEEARRYRSVVGSPITRDQHDMRPVADVAHARPYYADRVLVKRVDPPPDGRIVLMENQEGREKVGHQFGVVVGAAQGASELRRGDRVIYQRWPANEFECDGETFTFLFEEQAILAVLD